MSDVLQITPVILQQCTSIAPLVKDDSEQDVKCIHDIFHLNSHHSNIVMVDGEVKVFQWDDQISLVKNGGVFGISCSCKWDVEANDYTFRELAEFAAEHARLTGHKLRGRD
jgi:hypothetical protein